MITDYFNNELKIGDKVVRVGIKRLIPGTVVKFGGIGVGVLSERWGGGPKSKPGYTYSNRLIKIK